MNLPEFVEIREVGPREGFQFEPVGISLARRTELIESLSSTGLEEIEIVAFVHPDWVPQMADAEVLCEQLKPHENVKYRGIYLNSKGYERAAVAPNIAVECSLNISASETFSIKNNNCNHAQRFQQLDGLAAMFSEISGSETEIGVSAAFGCNYEGSIAVTKVIEKLEKLEKLANSHNLPINGIALMDTMGWANPGDVILMIESLRNRWNFPIRLHLHDTRGLGLANAYVALTLGVSSFDTAIGGMGGCPFGKHKGAAGNIATEDFAFLCQGLGIQTGIDLDKLIESALLAEDVTGHSLPGKVKSGGNINNFRASF